MDKVPLLHMKLRHFFYSLLLIFFISDALCYALYEENGKVGIKNKEGKILIPANYDAIGWSNGNFSVVDNVTGYRIGSRWGLIAMNNQLILKNEFDWMYPSGSLIIVSRKPKSSVKSLVGAVSTSGKQIIPFQYDGVEVHSLRAIVFTRVGNQFRYGLVDLQNKTLIPQQYQEIRPVGTSRFVVRNFEGRNALFTENGQQVSGFDIDSLVQFRSDYALIYQGKSVGLLSRDGEIKIQPKYREIQIGIDQIKVREADEWKLLQGDNTEVRRARYDSIGIIGSNLIKGVTGNHVELCDGDLKPIGNGIFSDIGRFQNGKAPYRIGDLSGVILPDGKILLPAIYHRVIIDNNFILANQKQGKKNNWILFDSTGARIISRSYEEITPLAEGIFAVSAKNYWGVMDRTGKEVVACAYDSILGIRDGIVKVKFKGLYGMVSLQEKWVVSPRMNNLTLISSSRYLEHTSTTTFLKEMNGNVIYFSQNPLEVRNDYLLEHLPTGNVWKIDLNGLIVERNVVPAEPIEMIFEESEGYRAIKRNGKYGFIDSRGRLRIANRYEDVAPFKEGYAAVKILGKWGFINLQDNIAVQPVYDEVRSFKNGFALVRQKAMYGLIDKSGKQILPVRYEAIKVLSNGNLLISIGGLAGLADHSGKILIQPRYEKLSDVGHGFSIVQKNGKYGVVNYNGISTIPIQHDYVQYDPSTRYFHALDRASWQLVKVQ